MFKDFSIDFRVDLESDGATGLQKCFKYSIRIPASNVLSLCIVYLDQYCVLVYVYAQCITVNQEIFMYENIHMLNIRVNKFLWLPHENILT